VNGVASRTVGTALAPKPPSFAVLRHHLIRRLEQATTLRVTQVVAPAGYGKSVLLAQWAENAQTAVAWVDLDVRDNSAIQFARSLVESLRRIAPDAGAAATERLSATGDGLGDECVASLVEDLALLPRMVLVFDNLESIRNGALLGDIATMIEQAPPNIHFVLASRSDAGIRLNRLRVRGELGELRQRDLAMDKVEAAELLWRVSRMRFRADVVDVLMRRTEGWPAGLQLAALSLRGRDDPEEFIRSFSGDDRHVAEYLTDEVLVRQPADVRRFLTDTSVLLRLSGPSCDAVTGRSDSQRVLERLDQSGLLIAPLDDTRTWFRYHPLLRDLLRYDLIATDAPRMRELLARAARWHEAHDELDVACQYLVAAEAWAEVGDLVRRHGRALIERSEAAVVVGWLAAIPEEVRRARLDLQLSWVVALVFAGRPLVADEELSRLLSTGSLTPWQEALAETTRAAMVHHHERPERAIESGRRALECLAMVGPDDEPVDVLGVSSVSSLRMASTLSLGRAWDLLGDSEEARKHVTECATSAEGTYRFWTIPAIGSLAYLEAREGELGQATALAARVFDISLDLGFAGDGRLAEAHLAMGTVARERNHLEQAAESLHEAHHRLRRTRRLALLSSYSVEAALLALAQDELDEGHAIIASTRTDGRPPPPPATAARLAAAEARLHLAAGDIERARRVLCAFEGRHTPDVAMAEAAVAVTAQDVPTARKTLDAVPANSCRRTRVEHAMWTAIVEDIDGDRRSARRSMTRALADAEPAGIVRVFLEARTDSLRLLRDLYHVEPTPFLRQIVEHELVPSPLRTPVGGIVEQLSDREMIVLRYLPSRLSNAEIAGKLYVSVNTLKTHLKHIYRKLGADNRSGAIARAEALRLL
jgi:LuxR family maltose regulon positive regulatory protein